MKYIVYLIFPLLLFSLYGGCSSGGGNVITNGNGDSDESQVDLDNLCFLSTSEDPCFDPNIDSETRFIDDMVAEEVIADEESKPGFIGQLEFTEIVRTLGRSIFLPPAREGCRWGDDGLVIKNKKDWDNYRNNCYFTDNFFDPPDVNFSEDMVLVSLKGPTSFGTEIVAVLEFEDGLLAIIEDTLGDILSSEARSFGSSVVEVNKRDLPVSFIRITDICNSIFNLQNSECLAQSMFNRCEPMSCGSQTFRFNVFVPNCKMIDCHSFACNEVQFIRGSRIVKEPGSISNLELGEFDLPIGIVEVEGVMEEFDCVLVVE